MTQAEESFAAFAAAAVDDMLAHQPTMATSLGDHRFDDRLDDLRPGAVEEETRVLSARLRELDDVDVAALPIACQVDAQVLSVRLRERLFALTQLREHTWDPLVVNPGTSLYLLLARDFAPLRERLANMAKRLAQVPEQLSAARAALTKATMPRVHVETAIDQFTGTLGLLENEIPRRLKDAPEAASEVEPALARGRQAVVEHIGWLREQCDGAAGNPRLGKELFARKLGLVLDLDRSPEQVLADALADIDRIEAEIAAVARR